MAQMNWIYIQLLSLIQIQLLEIQQLLKERNLLQLLEQ